MLSVAAQYSCAESPSVRRNDHRVCYELTMRCDTYLQVYIGRVNGVPVLGRVVYICRTAPLSWTTLFCNTLVVELFYMGEQ
jgi:hypothetical protein